MANKDSNKTGSQGGSKNPGNFANDREKASEAGRKGGQSSGGDNRQTESGRKGGRS
ncbi:stress-induced protein [Pseudomonas sp. 250J]|uniref:Stress-induced protein n=1 Tax=Pseudomonas peradeniyensis TaxID=2745488 RepID=A0ABT2VG27_9PSED|nr:MULTISPECIES: KGG domain-containing protein [Pseudomonas]KNX77909.1 stress-induced protein [Pseudomonas sp. 250J]MCU7240578.1 stress-induced protein [Pseudomonas peradeniyensis]MCU7282482.1 stress-induced protein [Pseudomonas peradeniyensis]QZA56881.1 stress-induced protein [Pseudomonas sp. 2hn]